MWEVNDPEPTPLWHHAQPQKPRPAKSVPPASGPARWHGPVTSDIDDDPSEPVSIPHMPPWCDSLCDSLSITVFVLACVVFAICVVGAIGCATLTAVGGKSYDRDLAWFLGIGFFVGGYLYWEGKEGI